MGTEPPAPHPTGADHRAPSGLFPAGPPRPTYREPHPVRPWPVLCGLAAGAGWLALFTLLGSGLRGQIWWLVAGGALAWAAALALARHGDRGVAVGVAVATGFGWSIGAGLGALYWMVTGDWPLW